MKRKMADETLFSNEEKYSNAVVISWTTAANLIEILLCFYDYWLSIYIIHDIFVWFSGEKKYYTTNNERNYKT